MTTDKMRATVHEGLLLGASPLHRHTASGRRAVLEGVVLTSWGPFGPDVNKVAVIGPSPPLARILELAGPFFTTCGGYGIVVEAEAGHPVEAELRAAGWQVFEDEPAMVMPTLPAPPPLPSGLEIRPVRDQAGRRDLATVLTVGFGSPTAEGMPELTAEATDAMVPSLVCARDPGVALLVGYAEGVPVSSAILFMVGRIAGITGVATIPTQRRRGFARALTWAALSEGAGRGCTCGVLAGLGAGYTMYRKMGFVHACNHRAYRPRESS